ncbi:hypothetical protein SLA2020_373160 [Shorea laevis]
MDGWTGLKRENRRLCCSDCNWQKTCTIEVWSPRLLQCKLLWRLLRNDCFLRYDGLLAELQDLLASVHGCVLVLAHPATKT